jgi:flagellar biosynthetic protein FliR
VQFALPTGLMVAFLLASLRSAAWLLVAPPFSSRAIPPYVRALLSMALALPIAPGLAAHAPAAEVVPLLLSAVQQVVIGGALGFVTSLIFAAVQAAGDLIDLFGGFSLGYAYDPLSLSSNATFGRFYNLLATTLLFGSSAHLLIIRGFTTTFRLLPLDGSLSLPALEHALTGGLAQMFVATLQIAGPLVMVLFLADVGLGLLSRVAPALNAFALGFPIKIFITLSLGGMALVLLPDAITRMADQVVRAVIGVAGA